MTFSRQSTVSIGGTGTSPASAGTGLYFDGTNAVAANGGNLILIYSPSAWSDGSSGSHLDTDFFTGSNALMMNHAVTEGLKPRALGPIEQGIMRDIGYQVSPIPEPSSALLGLLGLGFLLRRKRC